MITTSIPPTFFDRKVILLIFVKTSHLGGFNYLMENLEDVDGSQGDHCIGVTYLVPTAQEQVKVVKLHAIRKFFLLLFYI